MAKYQSPKMKERRRRILETAQTLLGENEEDFTMRDLAGRADVALGTLYNLFGSQEALLSEAIADIFDQRVERIMNMPEPDEGIVAAFSAWTHAAAAEIVRVPHMARKMIHLYFTSGPNNPVRRTMHEVPSAYNRRQLESALDAGELEGWIGLDRLASAMTDARYASLARWSAGEIPDKDLGDANLYVTLLLLAGALKGNRREQVRDALRNMKEPYGAKRQRPITQDNSRQSS